ncbi:MAG TPA: hypothetical protein VFQ53_08900 [Kofleriaceae bacterium]|nr:hypothetical protein [Kofleriaceae bacterium]
MALAPGHKRRHRYLTVPAGVVLFVCLFLPAVKGCSEPVYPIVVPPVYPPYVLGLLVTLTALARPSVVRKLVIASRVILWLTCIAAAFCLAGILVVEEPSSWMGYAVFAACVLVFVVTGWGERDELAAARAALATGLLGVIWFGAWLLPRDEGVLFGMYVSFGSSLALLLGAAEWRREIHRDHNPEIATAKIL